MAKGGKYPLHVRFRDLDSYGHVNNAVYLTYLEEGRMMLFKELVGGNWDWDRHGILLVKHEINYQLPILLHDEVQIELILGNVGTKSFDVNFEITKKRYDGEWVRCTYGKTVAVCFDHKNQTTTPVPDEWRAIFDAD